MAEPAEPAAYRLESGEAPDRLPLAIQLSNFVDRYGVLLLVLVMAVISFAAQPDVFLSDKNILNIFRQNAFYFMLALGQFIVIVTAGIDLSVGSILVLGMMVSAVLFKDFGAPWPVLVIAPLLVGLGVGMVNGIGLTKLRLPHPFIMTLGMMFIARGLANIISGGVPIDKIPEEARWIGYENLDILGMRVPASLFAVIATYILVWIFLHYVRSGRHIFAVGGNPQAARVSGVNVDRTLILAYGLCGLLAGFAGLIVLGRTGSGFPQAGSGDELYAIAAVIIGGASFFGGRGTVLGVFAGVLVLGLLRNLLNLNNVQSFWQQVLIGVIIIGVVAFDVVRRRLTTAG
ncbi:MAG: ABC transporter permease [Chloroflexota bacterium]